MSTAIKELKSSTRTLIKTENNYVLVAVGLSGIVKGKQKLGVTFDFDKLGGIDFTNFSKLTMCTAVPRRKPKH